MRMDNPQTRFWITSAHGSGPEDLPQAPLPASRLLLAAGGVGMTGGTG
jgi:hypothetical protein